MRSIPKTFRQGSVGIGSKQIDKIICIACKNPIGQHSKNGLGKCLFRIQGTYVANGKTHAEELNRLKAQIAIRDQKDNKVHATNTLIVNDPN